MKIKKKIFGRGVRWGGQLGGGRVGGGVRVEDRWGVGLVGGLGWM